MIITILPLSSITISGHQNKNEKDEISKRGTPGFTFWLCKILVICLAQDVRNDKSFKHC